MLAGRLDDDGGAHLRALRLALLPALGPQVEPGLLLGELGGGVDVQLDPEPGGVGEVEVAVRSTCGAPLTTFLISASAKSLKCSRILKFGR